MANNIHVLLAPWKQTPFSVAVTFFYYTPTVCPHSVSKTSTYPLPSLKAHCASSNRNIDDDTASPYLTPYKDPEAWAPQYLLREKNLCQTSKNLSVIQIYGCTSEEVEQLHFFFSPWAGNNMKDTFIFKNCWTEEKITFSLNLLAFAFRSTLPLNNIMWVCFFFFLLMCCIEREKLKKVLVFY